MDLYGCLRKAETANVEPIKWSPLSLPHPLPSGITLQDSQWMPEITDSTEPYIYYVFSYTYIPMIKYNL